MTRVKVLVRFRDAEHFNTVFEEGQELEFEDERARKIISLGLAAEIKTAASSEPEKTAVKKKSRKNL